MLRGTARYVLDFVVPPRIARTHAAVASDDLSRGLAIRLKDGRKIAIVRTMARYMAPLLGEGADRLLVRVPLHRRHLWVRGFNQSALVARTIAPSLYERRSDGA